MYLQWNFCFQKTILSSYLVQTLHEGLWLLLAWFMLTKGVESDSAPLLVDRKAPQLAGNIIPEVVMDPFIFQFLESFTCQLKLGAHR